MGRKRDFDDQEDLEPMTEASTTTEWGPEHEEPTPEPEVQS